jgi:heme exporter protein B
MFREVIALASKELMTEWRQRYAIGGLLLYVFSSVFVAYIGFSVLRIPVHAGIWNVLYWIIMLFAAVNSVARSFIQESPGRLLYYYTIASPQSIILSKILYHFLLMAALTFAGLAVFVLFLGNPVQNMPLFLLCAATGALGFASVFTLISGIASKASQSSVLMAILGFPIVLPMLLSLIRTSSMAIDGLELVSALRFLLVLTAIIVISITASVLLFPYLWRSN